jgi:hypothetical protein
VSAHDWVFQFLVGGMFAFEGWATGEPVNGNPRWYRDPSGNYFWSGGVR